MTHVICVVQCLEENSNYHLRSELDKDDIRATIETLAYSAEVCELSTQRTSSQEKSKSYTPKPYLHRENLRR